MPYATRSRKSGTRRRPQRSRRTGTRRKQKTNTTVFRSPNVIPDRICAKFPYATTKTMTTGATVTGTTFRNSMFDPDLTGGGHQPFMRDELSALYTKYLCYGYKYEITFYNAGFIPVQVAVAPFNHTGVPTTMDLAWEKPNNQHLILGPSGQANSMRTIRGYVDAAKTLCVNKSTFVAEKNYWATVGGNPGEEAYLTLAMQCMDGTTAQTVRVAVRLQMYTKYFDRAPVFSS